ncbi:FlgN protein [Salsuginibacillus halophilus]|uniref:FlgN protein n=1 Tax=Salsuginibacillus halophilus TaxID=517424 RepID=A0A2P8HQS2_9BACI|nr:flagellar protein FlgN [Salsuginibacillus halophilus]PSL48570.1 FlgN protein [Salsuginibacillus halophilus]
MAVKALFETLAELTRQHQTLASLAKEKTETIKQNDVEGLRLITKQENEALKTIRRLEGSRLQAVADIIQAEESDLVPAETSISDLKPLLPEAYHEPLERLQVKLGDELRTLQRQNELNQRLIRDSLQFVHMSLDLIQPEPEEVNYSRPDDKTKPDGEGYSMFDSRA